MTYPFLVSLILIRIPDEPDFDIAIGMVGANDFVGEYITTPFAEGVEEAFEFFDTEPPFEEFWREELISIPLTEPVIVNKYFETVTRNGDFFFSEPFVVDEVALSSIISSTYASLKSRKFRVSTQKRFEELLRH